MLSFCIRLKLAIVIISSFDSRDLIKEEFHKLVKVRWVDTNAFTVLTKRDERGSIIIIVIGIFISENQTDVSKVFFGEGSGERSEGERTCPQRTMVAAAANAKAKPPPSYSAAPILGSPANP